MNSSELRDTTMISMVRFAIIVLMAFRDLRFLSTVFLAHLTRLISLFFLFPMLLFSIQIPFLKKPGSSNKASRLASIVCSLVRDQVNWLFLVVTTVIVYEFPLTNENPVPEPEYVQAGLQRDPILIRVAFTPFG